MTKKPENEKRRGISLRKLNYFMAGITLIVSVLILISTYQTNKGYSVMREATEHYIDWQSTANEMQIGSDYLTDQVQCFVVTGDDEFLRAYFEEATVTRRRDHAVNALKEKLDGTKAYEALQNAMRISVELMNREYYAMRLILDAQKKDLNDYPQVLRDVKVDSQTDLLSDAEKIERARQMAHDEIYHLKKEAITREVNVCFSYLVEETENSETKSMDNLRNLLWWQQVLIGLLIVGMIVVVLLTSLQVISPLVKAIPHIRDEKPLPVEGAYEYRYLARTYNQMYESTRESKELLEFEATHDSLTGLFNRTGYDEICGRISLENAAFVLIDVDRFKSFNDRFGHDVGDGILRRVASQIKDKFRSEDLACRIGGDEFVVIMADTERAYADQIIKRIEQINIFLGNPQVGEQPASVSAGIAFGKKGISVDEIFKHADSALYDVKENGRHGCAVYED